MLSWLCGSCSGDVLNPHPHSRNPPPAFMQCSAISTQCLAVDLYICFNKLLPPLCVYVHTIYAQMSKEARREDGIRFPESGVTGRIGSHSVWMLRTILRSSGGSRKYSYLLSHLFNLSWHITSCTLECEWSFHEGHLYYVCYKSTNHIVIVSGIT